MRKFQKTALAAALLLGLSACGDPAATAPAQDAPVLVAYTQAEAFELCKTLSEDMIPDCLSAAADW